MIRIRRKPSALAERSGAPPPAVATAPAEPAAPPSGAASTAPNEAPAHRRLSARRFPALLVAAGLAGVGLVTARPRRAEAAYSTGTAPDGGDLVDTHLTVQGNLTVNSAVGIGTTSLTQAKLTVADDGTATGDLRASMRVLQTRTTGSASARLAFQDAGNRVKWELSTDAFANGTRTLYVYDQVAPAFRFLIDPSGNIGIGTTLPVERLDVVGNVRVAGTIRYESGMSGLVGLVDNDNHAIRSNGIGAQVFANNWGIPSQGWIFRDDANGVDRVTIQSAGNVGIGTSSPEARLHLGDGALKIGTRVIADSSGAYYAP